MNSPYKGQWRGASIFSLIGTWINGWVNYREAGDLRRHRAHYYATPISYLHKISVSNVRIFQNVIKKVNWQSIRPATIIVACHRRGRNLTAEMFSWMHFLFILSMRNQSEFPNTKSFQLFNEEPHALIIGALIRLAVRNDNPLLN